MKKVITHSKIEKVQSTLYWNYRIPLGSSVVESLIGENRRINCSINKAAPFNCALIPNGKGQFYINLNKEIRTKLNLEIGQEVALEIEKDKSEFGMPVPPIFEELLKQDPDGERALRSLSPGKIRSLLYVIAKPKSEQKQLEKGLVILDYLKESNGKLDYKELNESFKNNRFS